MLRGQTLHDHLKIKLSVLRAYFEKLDCDVANLVAVLHAKYDHLSWFMFHAGVSQSFVCYSKLTPSNDSCSKLLLFEGSSAILV